MTCPVTFDFEDALWRAVAEVLSDVHVPLDSGSVSKNTVVRQHPTVSRRLWRSSPLSSANGVASAACVRDRRTELRALFNYVHSTWIQSVIWPPAAWSAFRRPVRTNDVESWHNRLNKRARSHHLHVDKLVVGRMWNMQLTCEVSFGTKAVEGTKTKYKRPHGQLDIYWNEFEARLRSNSWVPVCTYMDPLLGRLVFD